jgi:hypothetical protein
MGAVLQKLAHNVDLKRFLKATRGEKKSGVVSVGFPDHENDPSKRPALIVNPNHRHVSTARLLATHQTLIS